MYFINIHGFLKKIKKLKINNALQYKIFNRKLRWQFGSPAIRTDTDPKYMVVAIGFEKKEEADEAIDLINGFIYFDYYTQSSLRLSAVHSGPRSDIRMCKDVLTCVDEITWDKKMKSRKPLDSRGSRDRSRSPLTASTSKIDMEIELIQKERLLIVEQRKLLLEKKRLELLKDYEPTSINDLERYAVTIDNQDEDEPQPVPHKPKAKVTPVPVLATRVILKQMKDCSAKRNIRLSQPLFFTLRKRVIEIIKGKSDMEMNEIVKIYREVYPIESDEVLLDRLETQIQIAENLKSELIKENIQALGAPGPSNANVVEVKNEKETKVEVINKKEETKVKANKENEKTKVEVKKKEETKVEVNAEKDDIKMDVSENKDTIAEFEDNELDDWLEDEKVEEQSEKVDQPVEKVDQQDEKVDQQDEEKNSMDNEKLNDLEMKEI